MKCFNLLLFFLGTLLVQDCQTSKNSTLWVSGFKTEALAEEGQTDALYVHKGEKLGEAKWENFLANIEDFEFEEGYLKKIEVKEEKLEKVPADASSIKYTLIKEMEKQTDPRTALHGKWMLTRLNDEPINRSIPLPDLEIRLNQMQVSGQGGCNQYSGRIRSLSLEAIQLGDIIRTEKACINKNIENEYFKILNQIRSYQVDEENLLFYDTEGKKTLTFMRKTAPQVNQRLHDIWAARRISGNPINRMTPTPRLEINLKEKRILGNDSCNDYSATIEEISDFLFILGKIASTKKMCPKMETADRYNKALNKVRAYQLEGLNLILLDENGEEILAFLKAD